MLSCASNTLPLSLESKVSRLRDWNGTWYRDSCQKIQLESKVSRLRDWNKDVHDVIDRHHTAVGIKSFSITRLKQQMNLTQTGHVGMVGIKSFSITRLKPDTFTACAITTWTWLESKVSRLRDWNDVVGPLQSAAIPILRWNQKFLDYEIETRL